MHGKYDLLYQQDDGVLYGTRGTPKLLRIRERELGMNRFSL